VMLLWLYAAHDVVMSKTTVAHLNTLRPIICVSFSLSILKTSVVLSYCYVWCFQPKDAASGF
jgi:hypothetical protein